MGRRENRQQAKATKLALAAAILGLVRVVLDLVIKIIDWLTG